MCQDLGKPLHNPEEGGRIGLRIEMCREVLWQVQHAARGVDNPRPSETVRSTPEGPLRCEPALSSRHLREKLGAPVR